MLDKENSAGVNIKITDRIRPGGFYMDIKRELTEQGEEVIYKGYAKMYYGYDMCAKCRNKLIERVQVKERIQDFEKYGGKCKKCGNTMRLTCLGENKKDDTLYKITFRFTIIEDMDKCIKAVMRVGDFSNDLARIKLNNENSILFVGKL